ncbi:HepT-like ribonuclease domain-containing protein [Treponema sp. R80B11-R83G3]
MLPNEKNDLLYLLNILEYIGKIWKYTEKINDAEELFELNEQMNLNASLTLLVNIGENTSKTTEELKNDYPNIEWQKIKDFRNRIVHDYVGIDLAIVYEIITNDLKILKPEIIKIIKEKIKQKIFDIEEIKICKESKYYNNIEFNEIL